MDRIPVAESIGIGWRFQSESSGGLRRNTQFLRIRLESDAIKLILENVRTGKIIMAKSYVHTKEIEAISDPVERMKLFGEKGTDLFIAF